MKNLRAIASRLKYSTVVWSWGLNGLRLASGVLLLPLLVRLLPTPDLGMYYVFLSLTALGTLFDFGFIGSIGRAVAYALGGAKELKEHGFSPAEHADAKPNYELVWHLLQTTRVLYRYLTLFTLVLVGAFGSWIVAPHVHETTSPGLTWLAWFLTLLVAVWEIYAGWWFAFLSAMNQMLVSTRLAVLAYTVKLALACALLLCGAGLLAVPLAGLVSSFLQRHLTRRHTLKLLADKPRPERPADVRLLLSKIWPNSWRQGIIALGAYLSSNANAFICLHFLGLAANAEYGLSLQVIAISQGMAAVWMYVKWPLVFQLRAQQDLTGLRRMMQPRFRLQALTFFALAGFAIGCGPALLNWFGSQKVLLPAPLLVLLALNALLDMHYGFWGTVISTENRLPFLWPALVTNACSLLLALSLIQGTSLGLGALVLAPLLTGCVLNYWYWPGRGAHSVQTTWLRFMFSRQP